MKKILFSILIVAVSSLHADYSLKEGKRSKSAIDRLPFNSVADMKNIPQKTSFYAKQIIPIPWSKQLEYDKEYNRQYFAPWSMQKFNEPDKHLTWQIRFVQKRKVYDDQKRLVPQKAWQWWIKNSNFENMDKTRGKAISIRHSNLRAFPTNTAAYRNPWKSTEGFPFDYNQNSELHLNTPLYISHYSLDRKWAFVHAKHAFGWVLFSDIALVGKDFITRFKRGVYAISTKDNLMLYKGSKKVSIVKLGTLFPLSKNNKLLFIAEKSNKGFAVMKALKKPADALVAKKPVKFTAGNVAYISQQFRNEPYGWGGKLFTRDCSSTTRDFLGCFGIFLGRNSATQAKAGRKIKIKGLEKGLKKQTIIKHAKPFRSLLYVPGHIGLYLGTHKGEPVILHTYWGVRLNSWDKHTLARTIITTTEPGKEHPQIREKSKLINTLQSIINF
ncbi:MAG: glycoside hydrolase [Sulfurovum sp.]|nr:glycoside hydrolase [Sulfurovum sp.]